MVYISLGMRAFFSSLPFLFIVAGIERDIESSFSHFPAVDFSHHCRYFSLTDDDWAPSPHVKGGAFKGEYVYTYIHSPLLLFSSFSIFFESELCRQHLFASAWGLLPSLLVLMFSSDGFPLPSLLYSRGTSDIFLSLLSLYRVMPLFTSLAYIYISFPLWLRATYGEETGRYMFLSSIEDIDIWVCFLLSEQWFYFIATFPLFSRYLSISLFIFLEISIFTFLSLSLYHI